MEGGATDVVGGACAVLLPLCTWMWLVHVRMCVFVPGVVPNTTYQSTDVTATCVCCCGGGRGSEQWPVVYPEPPVPPPTPHSIHETCFYYSSQRDQRDSCCKPVWDTTSSVMRLCRVCTCRHLFFVLINLFLRQSEQQLWIMKGLRFTVRKKIYLYRSFSWLVLSHKDLLSLDWI